MSEQPVTHKEAVAKWPPTEEMTDAEKIEILISVVDGLLALLPLGMIDTLRIAAATAARASQRIGRVEAMLQIEAYGGDEPIGEVLARRHDDRPAKIDTPPRIEHASNGALKGG